MNPTRGKLRRFLSGHDFPLHVPKLWSRILARISIAYWTARTKWSLAFSGCRYGRNLIVDGKVWIAVARRGRIRLGDNVTLKSRFGSNLVGLTGPTVLECTGEGRISIGDGSGLSGAVLSSHAGITIGQYVMLGGNVRIFDHDYHSLDHRARRQGGESDEAAQRSKPIVIEDDAFIGTQSIILKGVTIGARAVIGAGSVVSRDVPADEIWAGNPARCVRRQAPGVAGTPPSF